MLSFLLRIAASAGTLLALAHFAPSEIIVRDWQTAFVVAIFLGFVNALVKPVLLFGAKLLTLPLSCITLGLSNLILSWLLSGAIFYALAAIFPDFGVRNFLSAMGAALIMGIVNSIVSGLVNDKKREEK